MLRQDTMRPIRDTANDLNPAALLLPLLASIATVTVVAISIFLPGGPMPALAIFLSNLAPLLEMRVA